MRRIITVSLAILALLTAAAAPASAIVTPEAPAGSPPVGHGGWEPEAIGSFDGPAGQVCDFAVHWDVVVNEVGVKIVQTYPDGAPKQALADGALLLQVSNAETGTSVVADAGGRAIFEFGTDGSMLWRVVGPIIARLPAGTSNLPRGLYTIDGVYTVAFSPTGFKTITLTNGTIHNLCDDLA